MREQRGGPANLDSTVAANVRAELARRQIKQRALAEELGRGAGWLSRRLAGEVAFTVSELQLVADAIGVPIADLLAVAA